MLDKSLIKDLMRLGMAFEEACLASGLTEEEEDDLYEDEAFQRELRVEQAIAERDLLQRHNKATEIAEKRGQGQSAIQWRLEKLNPKRYSNKDTGEDGGAGGRVTINIVRGKKEE